VDNNTSTQLDPRRLEVLYEQAVPSLAASLLTTLVVAFALWDHVQTSRLIIWFSVFSILSGIRYYLVHRYFRSNTKLTRFDFWLHLYVASALVSGIMWGLSAYIIMLDDNVLYTGFLLMCIVGLIAGSISSYSVFHSVFYAFSLPAIILFSIFLYDTGGTAFNTMIYLSCFFFLFMSIIENRTHKIINHSIALQFNNTSLLGYVDDIERQSKAFEGRATKENVKNAHLEDELKAAKLKIQKLEQELKK